MDELLELLRKADQDPDIHIHRESGLLCGGSIDQIERLANKWLITPKGGCHWDNIQKVRDAGFRVYPGDKDSFGWLTGCIDVVGRGTVMFG